MRYSLSSRFRGTFLGAVIGLNKYNAVIPKSFSDATELKQSAEQSKFKVERLTVIGAENLIALGRFDADDWHEAFTKNLGENLKNYPATAILATLPIALFYHENEIKLRQNLQLALVALGQDDSLIQDGASAVGYAIAQSLKEKLNGVTLIEQTITFLGTQTQISQQLVQVQTLLQQQASLEHAVTQLSKDSQPTTAIALAFYCFLSTLEDFRLSVVRAAQTSHQPQLTTAIAGALSGAYNSVSAIPISWRLAADDVSLAGGEAEILQLSDSLVAVWSGVYNQAIHPSEVTAIAAPRVIRPR